MHDCDARASGFEGCAEWVVDDIIRIKNNFRCDPPSEGPGCDK